MTDRKITEGAFSRGPLRKILNKQAYDAHLTAAGRERVEAALKAGMQAEAKKFSLERGVGERHLDAIAKFSTSKKYSMAKRELLQPKERAVINKSLGVFFKQKPTPEPEVEKIKIVPPPRIEPKLPEPLPKAANGDSFIA